MLDVKLLLNVGDSERFGDLVRFESSGAMSHDAWGAGGNPIEDACGPTIYAQKALLSMSRCKYLDSMGVEWLLRFHKRFAMAGGMLIIHSFAPVVAQILQMMRMDLVLNLAENESQAIQLAQGATHGDG